MVTKIVSLLGAIKQGCLKKKYSIQYPYSKVLTAWLTFFVRKKIVRHFIITPDNRYFIIYLIVDVQNNTHALIDVKMYLNSQQLIRFNQKALRKLYFRKTQGIYSILNYEFIFLTSKGPCTLADMFKFNCGGILVCTILFR